MINQSFEFYKKLMNIDGVQRKDREINRLKNKIIRYKNDNPSLKTVYLNDTVKEMFIDSTNDFNIFTIKSLPNENFECGDIVKWENFNWLITSVKDEKKIYTIGEMQKCIYALKWINDKNEMLEVPCIIKSNTSETEQGSFIIFGNNKIICYIPFNKDTVRISRGMRFFIDNSDVSPIPYKVVGVDNVSKVSKGHGYIILTFDEDILKKEDNTELKICDYKTSNQEEVKNKCSKIQSNIEGIILGYEKGTIFTPFFIQDGVQIDDIVPSWEIYASNKDKLQIIFKDEKLVISALDPCLLGMNIKIKLSDQNNEYPQTEKNIKVVSMY